MAYQHIISKRLDPLFALTIGLSAALTRINREEQDKGRSAADTVDVLRRRLGIWWAGDGEGSTTTTTSEGRK
ncbi:hypothetical protein CC80DRAFT_237295 [Byssothecium circinans]|uniref:Non-classical export protein 1 n=1 Tax=Byssothecium circinans TaxID=147558 RepID=A0A6A5U919_9PLEO|nr:hypothetical protein CC80DRAFT_237295 [Byssothecium circinans]